MEHPNTPLVGTVHPLGEKEDYLYATVVCRHKGRLMLSRHRDRTTWETQGGHIEPGETPEQAARRELFEESGALEYSLAAVADYSAAGTHGVLFFADVHTLGPLPRSEMAEVALFDALPPGEALTYPGITPAIVAHVWAQCCQDAPEGT